MRLVLLLALFIFTASPVFAQDMLGDARKADPAAKLLHEGKTGELTAEDYNKLYYESCTAANVDASMAEYTDLQCGCTAAKMAEFMSVKDLKTLFTETNEGDFQEGRVMMLAYIPCMYDSVYQYVFDGCYYNQRTRNLLRQDKKVCTCYAREMGNYVASKGVNLTPGFNAAGFNSKKSVPNPLLAIITHPIFEEKSGSVFEKCVMVEERGWAK